MSKILVTGGAGYIGSFIVRQLREEGNEVIIIDNFSDGHAEAVKGFRVENIDLLIQKDKLENLFVKEKFDAVIHMASLIQMGESFVDPYKYFHQNLGNALNLLDAMVKAEVKYMVFSSSAGVYGTPKSLPIKEDDIKDPENPYGETKLMIEHFLKWFDKAHGIKSISVRYFNAAGAAEDGSIGEDHPDESHIIPIFIKMALKGESPTIFGDDYDTPDGTNVRDYVHVIDLAKAHTLAIDALAKGAETNSYNAALSKGYSNNEIIKTIQEVTGLKFEAKVGERRKGDAPILYASNEKIKKELGWNPKYDLKDMIKHAFIWHKTHPNGYNK